MIPDFIAVKDRDVQRPLTLTRGERWIVFGLCATALSWPLLPAIAQPQSYHHFADTRSLAGIPNAADVLSNLAFVAAGLLGLVRTRRAAALLSPATRASLALLFAGFVLTGVGSGYYHWRPSDATLVFDRLPMTIVFAGVIGTIVSQRVSERFGRWISPLLAAAGVASVLWWKLDGNLTPYAVMQFGGMLGVIVLLACTRRGSDPFPWWTLLAWYLVSKVFEAADMQVWHATGSLFAGHMLKHLAAAVCGFIIAFALPRGKTAAAMARRPLATRH